VSIEESNALARVKDLGVRSASTVDLVAVIISESEAEISTSESDSRGLMKRLGNIRNLAELSFAEFKEWSNFDDFVSLRSLAAIELGRRTANAGKGPIETIDGPDDVFSLLEYLTDEKKEHFVVVLLNSKSHILRTCQIHVGTLTMSIVGAREVFREAIREGASSLILAHNHPSGDPSPSPEDIDVTRELMKVGELLDIPVLDHVIIGYRDFRSLKRLGLM